MLKLKLRYEDGHFIPLDTITGLEDGDEIEVQWDAAPQVDTDIDAMLDRTAGMWADLDGIEELMQSIRQMWDEEWQHRLGSL